MTSDRTWERQDPRGDADLIDPGPQPGVQPLRPQQKELRRALGTKVTPMRKGVDK